jgi:DNA invertase Pin-like site-specific DNA recombinase
MKRRYVTYTRVSTAEQKKSGLGLEAQKRDIDIFLNTYSEVPWEVVGEFCDQGSGADNGRPEFQKALALVRKTGAELLVSKLDRLSRRVSFIASLMEDRRVRFRVAAMPHADAFQLHIYAALAEQERDFISKRTKAALDAARKRGVKLGGYREGALDEANARRIAQADVDARRVAGIMQPLREAGQSLQQIAAELTKQGIATPRGGAWTAKSVSNALGRLALMDAMSSPPSQSAPPMTPHQSDEGEGSIMTALRVARAMRARKPR